MKLNPWKSYDIKISKGWLLRLWYTVGQLFVLCISWIEIMQHTKTLNTFMFIFLRMLCLSSFPLCFFTLVLFRFRKSVYLLIVVITFQIVITFLYNEVVAINTGTIQIVKQKANLQNLLILSLVWNMVYLERFGSDACTY